MIPNMFPDGKGDPTQPVKMSNPIRSTVPTFDPTHVDLGATFKDSERRLVNGKVVANSADAYWFTQPPEVQKIYFLNTEGERNSLAHELADKGFLIDVPIMVWGWDPLVTMILRQNSGYTWVPSAKMQPVQVAPGLTFPGLPSYDPAHAPEGSIPVSTDWAKGLEKTNVWLYDSEGNRKA